MPADLHCHSKLSDGSTTVEELVMLAKRRGLNTISVTDHDTFQGSDKAVPFGEKYGVRIIRGAEVSSLDYERKRKVHLLCYLPQNPEPILSIMRQTLEKRNNAMKRSIQKILSVYPIPPEMIAKQSVGSTCIYKQHIMHALMDAGYTTEVFGDLFRSLFSSKTGIARFPIEQPEVFEVLRKIKESGGVAVLAHPAVYNSYELIPELIKNGLDGIEVSHPRAKESDAKELGELCDRYGLIKTGGTDFHGMNTPKAQPIGTCTASDEEVEKIIQLAAAGR